MKKNVHTMMEKTLCCTLVAGLLLGVTGCANGTADAVPAEAQAALISVETQRPQVGSLSQTSEFIGTIEPGELVSVLPKIGGTILRVNARVGDTVKKGDLLFEIDSTDVQLQVNTARASLLQAQAQVDQQLGSGFDLQMAQLQTQVEAQKNQYSTARQSLRDYNDGKDVVLDDLQVGLDQARNTLPLLETKRDTAKQTYEEERALLTQIKETQGTDSDAYKTQKKITDQAEQNKIKADNLLQDTESQISMLSANINDADDADSQARGLRTAVKNAQLAYESSNTIYELTKNDARSDALKVANASLGTATANFEMAAHQLDNTKGYAPIDGVIEGCNITENQVVGGSVVAFTVSNKTSVTAVFYVSADAVNQMAVGDKVTVESGQQQMTGTLVEVGSMADPQIGLFKIKAAVENGSNLHTGLAVKISAETAKAVDALLIPQSAVYYEEGAGYVYVNQNGIAVKTPITTGIANNEQIEVVTGLSADSELIVSWNPNLIDGAVIEAQPAATASTNSASEAVAAGAAATDDAVSAQEDAGTSAAAAVPEKTDSSEIVSVSGNAASASSNASDAMQEELAK